MEVRLRRAQQMKGALLILSNITNRLKFISAVKKRKRTLMTKKTKPLNCYVNSIKSNENEQKTKQEKSKSNQIKMQLQEKNI